jgi:hypothetical protein
VNQEVTSNFYISFLDSEITAALLALSGGQAAIKSETLKEDEPSSYEADDMEVDASAQSCSDEKHGGKLVFRHREAQILKLTQELGLMPKESSTLARAIKEAIDSVQSSQELFRKFRTKEQRREILRYIHEECDPQCRTSDPEGYAAAQATFFEHCKALEHEDFRRFKAESLRVNDKDEMIRLFEFESILQTMLKLMYGADWLSPISTGYGGGGRTGIIALVSPLEHAHREPSRHSGDWKRREYLVNCAFGEPGERVQRKRQRTPAADVSDSAGSVPANIAPYIDKQPPIMAVKLPLASVMTAPLLHATDAGDWYKFSEESKELLAALKALPAVDCVIALVGRSSTGKTLIAELLVHEFSGVRTSQLTVNPSGAAETKGINAVLMTRNDGKGSMLVLDTAGTDLAATPLQCRITTFLALSVATTVVFFVDGDLQNDELRFLAKSCELERDLLSYVPLLKLKTPIVLRPNNRRRLVVAYAQVSRALRFERRESAVEHTRRMLTARPPTEAESTRDADSVPKHCALVAAAYPLDQIGAVSIPVAEEALVGSTSLPAANVLERPGVVDTLRPVADTLLTGSLDAIQTGADVAMQLQNALAAVTSQHTRALLDSMHISRMIEESREASMAFLDDWTHRQKDFSKVKTGMRAAGRGVPTVCAEILCVVCVYILTPLFAPNLFYRRKTSCCALRWMGSCSRRRTSSRRTCPRTFTMV